MWKSELTRDRKGIFGEGKVKINKTGIKPISNLSNRTIGDGWQQLMGPVGDIGGWFGEKNSKFFMFQMS